MHAHRHTTTYTQIVQNCSVQNYGNVKILVTDGCGEWKRPIGLIKWDMSSIDPGTKVTSAFVTLAGTDSRPRLMKPYSLKRTWVELTATRNVYASGKRWKKAGAQGPLDSDAAVVDTIAVGNGWSNLSPFLRRGAELGGQPG